MYAVQFNLYNIAADTCHRAIPEQNQKNQTNRYQRIGQSGECSWRPTDCDAGLCGRTPPPPCASMAQVRQGDGQSRIPRLDKAVTVHDP